MDVEMEYSYEQFSNFLDLVECISVVLCILWWIKPQTQVEYVTFQFINHLYVLHKTNKLLERFSW